MKTINIFGQNIIKKVPMLMATVLFMSGFFIANFALAAHTADVTVDPQVVAGGGLIVIHLRLRIMVLILYIF